MSSKHKHIDLAVFTCLALTVASLFFIFKPKFTSALTMLNPTNPTRASRVPASIPEATSQTIVPAPFATTLMLDCQNLFATNGKVNSASVSSDHVILKFSQCTKVLAQFKKIELINKTNGYNAQIFRLGKAQFNSDFIQLDRGANRLEFEFSLNDGQKKQQILDIQRIR